MHRMKIPGVMGSERPEWHGRFALLMVLGLVIFSPPLFFIERYSLYSVNKIAIIVLTVALAMLLVDRPAIGLTAVRICLVALVQTALLLALPFAHQSFGYGFDPGYFNIAFQILAATSIFAILASSNRVAFFASFWVNLHLVIGALGLVVFVAGLGVNLQPITTFSERPYYDFGLAYTNVFYSIGNVNLIRVAGFYDEPGTFAFYITFALVLNRLFEFPRWKEWLLVLFGATSLSMAFFIVATIWLVFSLSKRHALQLILLAVLCIGGILRVDPEMREQIAHVTVDRFSASESSDRLVRGDNRTVIMRENYQAFLDAPIIGHGLHYERHVGNRFNHAFIANPIAPLATHGILGAISFNFHVLVLFGTILLATRMKRRDRSLIFFVLLLTLAQRPTTVNGLGYLLFIATIYRVSGGGEIVGAQGRVSWTSLHGGRFRVYRARDNA